MADIRDPEFRAFSNQVARLQSLYRDEILAVLKRLSEAAGKNQPDSLNAHAAALTGALNEVLIALIVASCDQFKTEYDDALEALITFSTEKMAQLKLANELCR